MQCQRLDTVKQRQVQCLHIQNRHHPIAHDRINTKAIIQVHRINNGRRRRRHRRRQIGHGIRIVLHLMCLVPEIVTHQHKDRTVDRIIHNPANHIPNRVPAMAVMIGMTMVGMHQHNEPLQNRTFSQNFQFFKKNSDFLFMKLYKIIHITGKTTKYRLLHIIMMTIGMKHLLAGKLKYHRKCYAKCTRIFWQIIDLNLFIYDVFFFSLSFQSICRKSNTPRFDDKGKQTPQYQSGKSPRSVRSTPRTDTSPRSMTLGDATPLYDENI